MEYKILSFEEGEKIYRLNDIVLVESMGFMFSVDWNFVKNDVKQGFSVLLQETKI